MKYTTLGRTGVTVSRLCFGTMPFGTDADAAMSAKLFHRVREAGVNFFDCANWYGKGRAEEILGELIRPCRDQLVITSKVCFATSDDPNDRGLSRRHIRQAVEQSLRRLGTDRLDVYFCHHVDPKTPVEETMRAMDDLVRHGKILYYGVSNWPAWQTALALGEAAQLNLAKIQVLQPMYSLAKRAAEIEILPLAQNQGLGVITYSPLGGGLLSGKYRQGAAPQQAGSGPATQGRLVTNKMYINRYADPLYREIAENFCRYADAHHVHPATLAVAWVAAHPAVTAPIIGARNLEQLEPSLQAADYEMSPAQWAEIAALTPPVPMATDRDEERGK